LRKNGSYSRVIGFGYVDVGDDVVGTLIPAGALRLGGFLMIVGFGGATERRFVVWAYAGRAKTNTAAIARIAFITDRPLKNRGFPCQP